jgi:hypothetical protein
VPTGIVICGNPPRPAMQVRRRRAIDNRFRQFVGHHVQRESKQYRHIAIGFGKGVV